MRPSRFPQIRRAKPADFYTNRAAATRSEKLLPPAPRNLTAATGAADRRGGGRGGRQPTVSGRREATVKSAVVPGRSVFVTIRTRSPAPVDRKTVDGG